MIWNREQYLAHCNFENTGREMFCELFGPLVGLAEEWQAQGATQQEIDMVGWDWDFVQKTFLDTSPFANTGLTEQILEDNDVERIIIDTMGRKSKLCKNSASIPLPLTHPVEEMDDWLAIKHWYAFDEKHFDVARLKEQRKLWEAGTLTIFEIPGGFDEPRQLLGEEEVCVACYTEPEMIEDMLNIMAERCIKGIELVAQYVPIDVIFVHEDLAGKSGPLWGPKQIDEFAAPYYKKVWAAAQKAGAKLFSLDSDGDINPILDNFAAAGINAIHPCEPGSGMDIVAIRKKYGNQFALKGGIDKYALRGTKEDIKAELERKICPETLGGGVIFGLDHRIPNGVSLENYRYYVTLAREMLGMEPISGEGWERMAF